MYPQNQYLGIHIEEKISNMHPQGEKIAIHNEEGNANMYPQEEKSGIHNKEKIANMYLWKCKCDKIHYNFDRAEHKSSFTGDYRTRIII